MNRHRLVRSSLLLAALVVAPCVNAGPLIQGIHLNGPQLQGIGLNGPILQGVVLNGPLLQGVAFNGPILQGVILNGPMLQGTRLNATHDGRAFAAPVAYGRGEGVRPLPVRAEPLGHSPMSGLAAQQVSVRLPPR